MESTQDSKGTTSIWTTLGIAPTSDLASIRAAFRSGESRANGAEVKERRCAYETALLWSALGLPPENLEGWAAEELAVAFERPGSRSSAADRKSRTATEYARRFWASGSFPPGLREASEGLHVDVEVLATAMDRSVSPEEQERIVSELLSHPSLENPEVGRELELLFALLLAYSSSPAAVELAASRFGWRRHRREWTPLHQILVGELLISLHAFSMMESLRDQGRSWWRSWPKDPEPLAAAALSLGYRPVLFLYASCSERAWFRMRQYWNDLSTLHPNVLARVLGPESHDYWARRLPYPPPPIVALAQRLQLPVLLLSAVLGVASVIAFLAPQPAFEASTTMLALLAGPFTWLTVCAGHLAFFALVWTLDRLWGQKPPPGRSPGESPDPG